MEFLTDKENDPCFRFLMEAKFKKLKEGYQPANIEKMTKWAVSNFESWKAARERAEKESCPNKVLQSTDPSLLCLWLSCFTAETRTTAGRPYLPPTAYQLLT